MLLVVYFHITMTFGIYTDMIRLLSLVRMPMFLAISGFAAFSLDYDPVKIRYRSLNRLIRQLYPSILFWLGGSIIISVYELHSIPSLLVLLCNPYKGGNWFTFALAELFFLALPLLFLFNKKKLERVEMTLILAVVALSLIFIAAPINELIDGYWLFDIVGNALSLKLVIWRGCFFFLGMIAKLHHQSLERASNKWYTLVGAMLCFAVFSRGYFLFEDGIINKLAYYLSAVSGMLALYCIFLKLTAVKNAVIKNIIYWFTVVGKRTLEIYLLHWFVLLFAQPLVVDCGLENVLNTWYEFPVVFAIAIAIAITILSFVKLLKLIGVYEIFFPQSTEKVLAFVNACRMKLRLSNPV